MATSVRQEPASRFERAPRGVRSLVRPAEGLLWVIAAGLLVVREGTDRRTLERAVGHVSGTALPGQSGNVCLAAHRDTFFRRLEGVRKNDTIRITTPEATYEYTVQGTSVVDPGAVEVLASTGDAALTLVTCYPFGYVGPAPRRFIVSGRLSTPPEPVRAGRPAALLPSR